MPLLAVRGNGPASAYGFGALSGKPGAMTAIASTTLSTTATTVTFNSIPNTYDDLQLIVYGRADTASNYGRVRFNNDSGTNYSFTYLYGNGTSALSAQSSNNTSGYVFYFEIPSAANTFGSAKLDILNYANTTYNKSWLVRDAHDLNGSGTTDLAAGLYRSTSAISRLDVIIQGTGNFAAGSVFALYGIKKA